MKYINYNFYWIIDYVVYVKPNFQFFQGNNQIMNMDFEVAMLMSVVRLIRYVMKSYV